METQWLGKGGDWKQLSSPADIFVALHMNMLLVPFCCTLMLSLATLRTTLGTLLSTSSALLLGEISYSTYLSHPLVLGVVKRLFPQLEGSLLIVVDMAMILAASLLLYWLVEVPAKRLLRRAWLKRHRYKVDNPRPP